MTRLELKQLIREELQKYSDVVNVSIEPNSNKTATVSDPGVDDNSMIQSFQITNLRRDLVNIELKTVSGVTFITLK